MEIAALMEEGNYEKEAPEFDALASSPLLSGDVKLCVGENALIVYALFETIEITFTNINELSLAEYAVIIKLDSSFYSFSRMGCWLQVFFDSLFAAYNKAVLYAMQISAKPIFTTQISFHYNEGSFSASNIASLNLYENCLVFLPPDLSARRVPLNLISSLHEDKDEITLQLINKQNYYFTQLACAEEPLMHILEEQINKLRGNSQEIYAKLDITLTAKQITQITGLMSIGAIAPISQLMSLSPTFVAALEEKLSLSSIAFVYQAYKRLCDNTQIWLGFREDFIWLITPSPDNKFAALEFFMGNDEVVDTLVYHTGGDFNTCSALLTCALEAVNYQHEIICFSEEDFHKKENAAYYMIFKRNMALPYVCKSFAGRVIHSSPESWQRNLLELWSTNGIVSVK
ncbi:MAG: hypothetical protein FWG61_08940 [Firmicutes bacterium]|nr:hypothetical protein [Bacillota bacterium]